RVVADLSVVVPPPALHSAGDHRTAVILADGDGADTTRQAVDIDRRVALRVRVIADLPESVPAPALGSAAGGYCARMRRTGLDCADTTCQPGDVDGRQALFAGSSIADLAGAVLSPALHASGIRKSARMRVARRDGLHATCQSGDINWREPF